MTSSRESDWFRHACCAGAAVYDAGQSAARAIDQRDSQARIRRVVGTVASKDGWKSESPERRTARRRFRLAPWVVRTNAALLTLQHGAQHCTSSSAAPNAWSMNEPGLGSKPRRLPAPSSKSRTSWSRHASRARRSPFTRRVVPRPASAWSPQPAPSEERQQR